MKCETDLRTLAQRCIDAPGRETDADGGLIAIIAPRLSYARVDIQDFGTLRKVDGERRGVIEIDGVLHPFLIVTRADHLRGFNIAGFRICESAKWMNPRDLREIELIAAALIARSVT